MAIKFEMAKEILLNGLCNFKTYDSIGYSCGETTVFLYNDYVYLYNDECDSYKYDKPYSQCTENELIKFVNSTIDSGGEFAWDDFISKEEWNEDYKKHERWSTYEEHIEELATDRDYDIFKAFAKPKPKKQITIKTLTESEINGMTYPRYLASCILATSDLENEEYYEEEDRITRILTNEFKNINKTI